MKEFTKEFTEWDEAHKAGYYTKVQLTLGIYFSPTRKPMVIIEPDAFFKSIYSGSYPLYYIGNTELMGYCIKQPLPITRLNIGYALYIINRATKKIGFLKKGPCELEVRRAQILQRQFYVLKRQVIMRLITENAIDIIGYQKKDFTWQSKYGDALDEESEKVISENENKYFYILYGISTFKFHLPSILNEIQQLKLVGNDEVLEEIDFKIPRININKAEELLERYLLSEHPIQHWELEKTNNT